MVIQDVLSSAGFKQMPFRIVPPTQMENILWAGDKSLIDELYEAALSPRPDYLGTSEFVLLYGDFGSGKTNALKWVYQKLNAQGELVVYLGGPSVADKPNWHDIVRSLFTQNLHKGDIAHRLSHLRKWVLVEAQQKAQAQLGPAAAQDPDATGQLQAAKLREIAETILPEAPGFVRFAMDLSDPSPSRSVDRDRNWSYLAGKPPANVGQGVATEYGLPADGLQTDYAATQILSSLIRLLTYVTPNGVGTQVFSLLMDEVEGIPDLPPASRLSILGGLRDLVNACTEHVFLALAGTASDASELWGILDVPLMQRLSRQPLSFAQMDPELAKKFMLDLMQLNRTDEFTGQQEWPFTADGLDAFVANCPPPLTPRKLLLSAQRLVFQAGRDKVVSGLGIDAGDVSVFNSWAG
jgi:hypothetical protein